MTAETDLEKAQVPASLFTNSLTFMKFGDTKWSNYEVGAPVLHILDLTLHRHAMLKETCDCLIKDLQLRTDAVYDNKETATL